MAKSISANSTPAEIRSVLYKLSEILGGKTNSYERDWNKIFGGVGIPMPMDSMPHDMDENHRIEKLLHDEYVKSQEPKKKKPESAPDAPSQKGVTLKQPEVGHRISRGGYDYDWNGQQYLLVGPTGGE